MARFIKTEGEFRIYELDERECRQHLRAYPTIVCWNKDDHDIIGNVSLTEHESETIEEMIKWCKEHSYSRAPADQRSEL